MARIVTGSPVAIEDRFWMSSWNTGEACTPPSHSAKVEPSCLTYSLRSTAAPCGSTTPGVAPAIGAAWGFTVPGVPPLMGAAFIIGDWSHWLATQTPRARSNVALSPQLGV
jgi:hypothetical protein